MNIQEFFNQGGYAFYVWGAYGMAVVALSLEIITLNQRRKAALTRVRRMLRRQLQETGHENTA